MDIIFFVLFAIFGIVFFSLIIFLGLNATKIKAWLGEKTISIRLEKLDISKYVILNDIFIKNEKGTTSQIDHLVVSVYGIFVIETKNYSGLIYGDDKRRYWTQVLNYGKNKYRFYNPILQNKNHIYALSKIIGKKDCFISIIVFPKAQIMTHFSEKVGSISDMKKWLEQKRDNIFDSSEINEIYKKIIIHKNNPKITSQEHIKNIHKLQQNIKENICPRCNNKLILKEGKYGDFYGCSSYPNCKFIKNNN